MTTYYSQSISVCICRVNLQYMYDLLPCPYFYRISAPLLKQNSLKSFLISPKDKKAYQYYTLFEVFFQEIESRVHVEKNCCFLLVLHKEERFDHRHIASRHAYEGG